MHYVINVAQRLPQPTWNGKTKYVHLFATAEHSLRDEAAARDLLNLFLEKFPVPEYELTLTRWMMTGEPLVTLSATSEIRK
jgi:hypothetical protein